MENSTTLCYYIRPRSQHQSHYCTDLLSQNNLQMLLLYVVSSQGLLWIFKESLEKDAVVRKLSSLSFVVVRSIKGCYG